MFRAVSLLGFLSLTLFNGPARACKCETSFSSCREVGASDLIFIGTVQSIEPIFMSRWYMTDQSPMRSLSDAYADAQQHPSAEALDRLKNTYLNIFPGLAPDEKRQLQAARSILEVGTLFSYALDRGMRVRLKVRTLFKHEDDDKDEKKAEKKNEPDFFDVWTTFDDCGIDFQIGETYLVYANTDEFGTYYFTGRCTRTSRLSDAGEDLAYLFFYKDHPEQSGRLEGFTTTERLDFDPLHDPETVQSPVAGVIVELKSESLRRYAETDKNGRFLFDGLPDGDYQVSAFASGYPLNTQLNTQLNAQLLAGPKALHIKAASDQKNSCARQILLIPK
jgi:hypothetical protein